jgi:hypothetical protein
MMSCEICHNRKGKHYYLVCPNEYNTVDELLEHQRKRKHPGGHLAAIESLNRRDRHKAVLDKMRRRNQDEDDDDDGNVRRSLRRDLAANGD